MAKNMVLTYLHKLDPGIPIDLIKPLHIWIAGGHYQQQGVCHCWAGNLDRSTRRMRVSRNDWVRLDLGVWPMFGMLKVETGEILCAKECASGIDMLFKYIHPISPNMRTPNFSQYAEGAIKKRARKKKQISWGHCQSRVTKKHLERNTCWTVEDRCFSTVQHVFHQVMAEFHQTTQLYGLWAPDWRARQLSGFVSYVSFIECLIQHIWLVVWKCLEHVLFFHSVGDFIIPTDELHHFFHILGIS